MSEVTRGYAAIDDTVSRQSQLRALERVTSDFGRKTDLRWDDLECRGLDKQYGLDAKESIWMMSSPRRSTPDPSTANKTTNGDIVRLNAAPSQAKQSSRFVEVGRAKLRETFP